MSSRDAIPFFVCDQHSFHSGHVAWPPHLHVPSPFASPTLSPSVEWIPPSGPPIFPSSSCYRRCVCKSNSASHAQLDEHSVMLLAKRRMESEIQAPGSLPIKQSSLWSFPQKIGLYAFLPNPNQYYQFTTYRRGLRNATLWRQSDTVR